MRGDVRWGPAASLGCRLCQLTLVQGRSQQICCSAPSGAEPLVKLLSLPACAWCKLSITCRAFGKLSNTSVLFSEAKAFCLSVILQLDRDLNRCGTMRLCGSLWVRHLAVGRGWPVFWTLWKRQNVRRGGRSHQEPRLSAFQFNTLGPHQQSWGENAQSTQKGLSSELNNSLKY